MSDRKRRGLGDISVNYVRLLAEAVTKQRSAAACEQWLKEHRLTPSQLNRPDRRISIPHFMRLGEAAIRLCNDPTLGIQAAAALKPADLGLAGMAAACAQTLGHALDLVVRYERLLSHNVRGQSRFTVADDGSGCTAFYSLEPYNRYNYFVVDMVLAGWTALARQLTGAVMVIREVHIEYPDQGHSAAFEEYFGCRVRFGQEKNQLLLSKEVLEAKVISAHPATYQTLENLCSQALEALEQHQDLPDRVRRFVAMKLKGQAPSIADIAGQLGMAEWTLRRRLDEAGTSYREILDELRSDLALAYVRDTALTFSQISDLLGFSNAAAFHRAFARWHKLAPGTVRRQPWH